MDDHQKRQGNAEKHKRHAETEKEAGIFHKAHPILSTAKSAKFAKKCFYFFLAFLAGFAVNLLIQPASHKMIWLWLEIQRLFFIAQPRDGFRAARMKAASFGRVDQTRRFAGRQLLERFGVAKIWVGCGGEQRVRVWV